MNEIMQDNLYEQKDQIVEQSPKQRFIRFNDELGFGAYKIVYKGYDNDSGCEIAWNPRLKIIKSWCKQILTGLNYLHQQEPHPIIHRDIKCENIFINTSNNQIRIGDLGLALTLKTDYTGSILGTPEFMAPEIYEEKYGTPVDIYAFGMCLLEMATLEVPYKECRSPAQLSNITANSYKKTQNMTMIFSSCAKTGSENEVFDTILQKFPDADLFIHLGDLHYADITINKISLYKEAFYRVFQSKKQRNLFEQIPILYVWDDHDYGDNDSGFSSPSKESATQIYMDYTPHYD
ncbi:protein kinase domain protein [Ichthyophthirius multifiliis]|uniref:Protein kinase domain protein n=1 Tax=Ichthyophthirius multifiliis TaxID=5932 RepID=G0QXK9_ICHMU|nr:protein kinase domain protein [Ichthyophthirius multifiliis]EGR30039.1 protein kinase domain protein [Ichthyophthirius multifiliis]|eukprot:XP_004031275.1 protein kinase domain protein [Ichthyophthirius multifiliis]